jgi:hypothetical protein
MTMSKKITRMEKRPGISVLKLLNATQMKIVTTGAYAVGEGLELKFRARVRLDDCQGVSDDGEKSWVAHLVELYPEGGSKCQEANIQETSTPTNTRKAMKDQIREKIRLKHQARLQPQPKESPSATE